MIANGLTSVMVAHVLFPEVDEAPAGFSARWIQQELRAGLGFTGAVFSDDLSMGGAAFAGTVPERARRAIDAGCDLLPICNDRPAVLATLAELEGGRRPAEPGAPRPPARPAGAVPRGTVADRPVEPMPACDRPLPRRAEPAVERLNPFDAWGSLADE